MGKYLFIATMVVVLSTIVACKKEPEQSCSSCPVGGSVATPQGFTYTKNGGTAVTADSAFFIPASNTIVCYSQGGTNRVILKTSSQAAGTYSVSTVNKVSFIDAVGTYSASGGSISITANANNKMSASFVSNGTGAGYISVNGQFQDIPKK